MVPKEVRKIEKERLLFVEGKDEENLLSGFTQFLGLYNVQILDIAGKDNFGKNLPPMITDARIRGVEIKAIGVIRDADANPAGAFQSVQDVLRNNGLDVPVRHTEFTTGSPKIGIFLTPDGQSNGAIEALIWDSICASPSGGCIESYMNCLRTSGELKASDEGKAKVHAYLAAQTDPTSSVGLGACHQYWLYDHDAFSVLRDFISAVAEL